MVRTDLNDVLIDEMTDADVPSVAEIERLSFTVPWSETSFLNQLKSPRSFSNVARTGNRITGYICAGSVVDEGHILTLAVHPDFRGGGIASRLIKSAIDHLRDDGCRSVYLEVRTSNEEAKRIYEGFGFRVIGLRKSYYIDPVEDGVIMSLRFAE